MVKLRDKFFLVDFDRCLNSVDACFNIFQEVVEELGIMSSAELSTVRNNVEASGGSFLAIDYLEKSGKKFDFKQLEKLYIDKSQKTETKLLVSGALEFIDFLRSNDIGFCIMTYGEARWQKLKIDACGLQDILVVLTSDKKKSIYINQWVTSDRFFKVPGSYFVDNIPKSYREVVLIDDKVEAFSELHKIARGYLVGDKKGMDLPVNIQVVSNLTEIITAESRTAATSVG